MGIMKKNKLIFISVTKQEMTCFEDDQLIFTYQISTGKNGVGELINSERTPRGWHKVHSIIGLENEINSVFVFRKWTGEIYSQELAQNNLGRDWILTRILQLDGMEPGRNKGGDVDSLRRHIYIHGTPDSIQLGVPGSRGCIRMRNSEIISMADWATTNTLVCIE
jgi:hypothetical protein